MVDGRKGIQPPYDTVSGPMFRNLKQVNEEGASPKGNGQQTTFLSNKAVSLLNSGMKGRINDN